MNIEEASVRVGIELLRGAIERFGRRIRVRVDLGGPIGVDSPSGNRDYVITVRNRGTSAVGVDRAGLLLRARGSVNEFGTLGTWSLDLPNSSTMLEARSSESFVVRGDAVRDLLVNKGNYQGEVRGFVRLGTGRWRFSRPWRTVDRPRAPGFSTS